VPGVDPPPDPVPGGGDAGGGDGGGGDGGGVDGGVDDGGGVDGVVDVELVEAICGAPAPLPQPERTKKAARASATTPRSFGGVQKLCTGLPSTTSS
jgi:hypothetical protein